MTEEGGGLVYLLIGGWLLYWGVNRRWLAPRRMLRAEQEEHEASLGDPERMRRISAYQDGSWFSAVAHLGTFHTEPCTWYSPTPSGQIKERDAGTLSLTPKGIRLSGAARSLELPYARIVNITAKRDGLVVERSTGPHVIIAVADPVETAEALSAIARARGTGTL
jgi:hypothetical protein